MARPLEWTDLPAVREQFWRGLQARSQGRTALFMKLTVLSGHFLSTSAGRKGFSLGYTVALEWASVDLYIDTGDRVRNKAAFDALHAEKDVIEAEMGMALEWERLENKRASRITRRFEGGLTDQTRWDDLHDRLIEAMIRLDRVFRPRIARLEG